MDVIKVIEIMGTSDKSWEDAANRAVKKALASVRNVKSVDVVGMKGKVKDGKISEYRAHLKVAFNVE